MPLQLTDVFTLINDPRLQRKAVLQAGIELFDLLLDWPIGGLSKP